MIIVKKIESRLTLVVSLLILSGAYWLQTTPAPYRYVVVDKLERTDDYIEFVATFLKTACKFERLEVVGERQGLTSFVKWGDLDEKRPDTDRTKGKQTLRIFIDAPNGYFDWLEIRTRHTCNDKKVDRIFHRIQPTV